MSIEGFPVQYNLELPGGLLGYVGWKTCQTIEFLKAANPIRLFVPISNNGDSLRQVGDLIIFSNTLGVRGLQQQRVRHNNDSGT